MNDHIPIPTIHLFQKLDEALLNLLKTLTPEEWEKSTLAPLWTVKDLAAHLLDGNLRTLSMLKDGYFGEKPDEPIESFQDLAGYLDRLNADWVKAAKRLSPRILIELLERTGSEYTAYLQTLDPFAQAAFSVAWAGESVSANWFHIAREYTEKWHHQQQIRFATGREAALYTRELYHPYLETSMRALPHHYRNVPGAQNEVVQFEIGGEAGGIWNLKFENNSWTPVDEPNLQPACQVFIPPAIAWRIFTKGISREAAEKQVKISGKIELGLPVLDMVAVMTRKERI